MATKVGSLLAELGLNSARYEAGLKSAAGSTSKFQKQAQRKFNNVSRSVNRLAAAAAGIGFSALVKNSLDSQAALFDMSKRLGTTAEGLSRLQYAAEQTGVSTNTLNMGLQRQTRRIAEAAAGFGEARGALSELGLSAQSLNQLRPEEQFKVLADSIMQVESPADRVRLAMKLFDSEGVSLIQTMQGGSAAISALGDEADRMGQTVSGGAAEQAKAATDAFTRMAAAGTGVANTLAIQLAPHLEETANWLAQNIPDATVSVRKAFKLLAAGALEISKGFIDARVKWNEFTRDFEEAERLKKISTNLAGARDMIFEQVAALEKGTTAMEGYSAATDKARYSLESLSIAGSPEAIQAQKEGIAELENGMNEIFTRINNRKAEGDKQAEAQQKGHLAQIAAINTQGAKKATAITKSAAIADATINGYKAIQAALAAPPGFPLNLPQVAITTAMQFANLAAIKGASFAGGGFTGYGARVGGMDGKGGFPAMLHPNETVIDHTRGQAAGATVNFNITTPNADGFGEMLENERGRLMSMITEAMNDQGRGLA